MKVHVTSTRADAQALRLATVITQLENLTLTADPETADVILMPDDDARLIAESPVFKAHKRKCIAVSDGDILSYFIPALYASNHRTPLSKHRALTAGPYSSLFEGPLSSRNAWLTPLKDVPMEKRYLYSFMGGSTSMVRKRLFRHFNGIDHPDVMVECTDQYKHWSKEASTDKSARQKRYVETMKASKFALCPRGASASSIRMFEAMELGTAPVVLADSWIPVDGVDWSFCLFVKEARLHEIDAIVRAHEGEWLERGKAARRTFEECFSPSTYGATLERQFSDLLRNRDDRRELLIRALYPIHRAASESRRALRSGARRTILTVFRTLGLKFPYELNR